MKQLRGKMKNIDPKLPFAIICDLDGTLALFKGNPYDRDYSKDDLNGPVAFVLRELPPYATVLFVSGRKEKSREITQRWIYTQAMVNKLFFTYKLFMRKDGDNREDTVVKREIYNREIKKKYNVIFVMDDRNRVVAMWRKLGLTCFQVAEGSF